MKSFTDYLMESKKTWKFKIKTVHELTDEQCDRIEKHLMKYDSNGLGAAKKSILQSAPKDFPQHRGYEVFTYEFETNLSAVSSQIQNEVRSMLGLADNTFKIRGEHEPDHDDEAEAEAHEEDKSVKGEDFHGEKHIDGFIKDLLNLRKEKEKGNE